MHVAVVVVVAVATRDHWNSIDPKATACFHPNSEPNLPT